MTANQWTNVQFAAVGATAVIGGLTNPGPVFWGAFAAVVALRVALYSKRGREAAAS